MEAENIRLFWTKQMGVKLEVLIETKSSTAAIYS